MSAFAKERRLEKEKGKGWCRSTTQGKASCNHELEGKKDGQNGTGIISHDLVRTVSVFSSICLY